MCQSLSYRAQRAGVPTVAVDPRHTSRTCSAWGHCAKANHRSQAAICSVLMLSLTTTQRDLLCQLLVAEQPASAAALGAQLRLTPRQVQYGLREIRPWLDRRNLALRNTPGVGVQLIGEPAQKRALLAELRGQSRLQLILTADQRQQLLVLRLLTADEPVILDRFQHELAVSRLTVLRDLEVVEARLQPFGLELARRQHRGWWVAGPELLQRQALAALFWGSLPCERPLTQISNGTHVAFSLAEDAAFLPIVTDINRLIRSFDMIAARTVLAEIEAELGGHFAEEAFVWLTLALAIQRQRAAAGRLVSEETAMLAWAQAQAIWPVVEQSVSQRLPTLSLGASRSEASALAAHLCAAPRAELWRIEFSSSLDSLLKSLMQEIALHYALPELAQDELLRAGLEAHILPTCVRQRFALWSPTPPVEGNTSSDGAERLLITRLSGTAAAALGAAIPPDAEEELALLLQAALVRVQPERFRRVLVVCPSGMATTQLLVARLRARLPYLGTFEVLPLRALSPQRAAMADLIISTVPLPNRGELPVAVIQVHPALRSDDIAALMRWLGEGIV